MSDARQREKFVWMAAAMAVVFAEVARYAIRNPGSWYIETEERRQSDAKQGLASLIGRPLTRAETRDLGTVMDVQSIQRRGIAGLFDLDRRSRASRDD